MKKDYYILAPTREGGNYYVKFAHIPGKRFSAGTSDRDAAVRWAENKMRHVTLSREKPMTLADFCRDFFGPSDPHGYRQWEEKHKRYHSEEYYAAHQARLVNHILPYHGAYLLTAITDLMIENLFMNAKSVKGDGTQDLSDNARNKILATYRIVLDRAHHEKRISSNPAKEIEVIREEYDESAPFEEDEMAKLFPADDEELIRVWYNLRWAAYFSLMKDTSWRPGEVGAFSKSGFFPHYNGSSFNVVYTSEEVHWRTHKIVPRIKTSHTKGGAKFKVAFISDQTVRLLERLGQQVKGDYFFELRTDDLCFSHRRKDNEVQYIYSELANKRLRSTAEAVGIDLAGRTQYRFRHTWDTNNFGMIPEDLRNLIMGHVKTRKEYVHLSPEKAIDKAIALATAAGQSIVSDKAGGNP
ncbi:MAG: hypothetical protein II903_08670 [Spirochaetales bacterium]|nr:hypothetical protein [Spirochaetales bacterium]